MNDQTPRLTRRTLLRGAVGAGALAAFGLPSASAGPRPVAAADLGPSILDCDTWGALEPTAELTTLNYRPSSVIVHHMAFPNTTDYSLEAAYAVAHECQDLHMGNGWGDTGQQFSVSRGGYMLEGRHGSLEALQGGESFVMGAQAKGYNDTTIGIENEGTYTSELPPQQQWDSLVSLLVYICTQYGLGTDQIISHRDVNPTTECPGQLFYDHLPQLREDVGAVLG